MSKVRFDLIWHHRLVMPYILGDLKQQIEKITPVKRILLFGSRSKIAFNDWDTLQGKDWDIIVVTSFPITKTHIWTYEKKYHIDLKIMTESQASKFIESYPNIIELYPKNQLSKKRFLKRISSFLKKQLSVKLFKKRAR